MQLNACKNRRTPSCLPLSRKYLIRYWNPFDENQFAMQQLPPEQQQPLPPEQQPYPTHQPPSYATAAAGPIEGPHRHISHPSYATAAAGHRRAQSEQLLPEQQQRRQQQPYPTHQPLSYATAAAGLRRALSPPAPGESEIEPPKKRTNSRTICTYYKFFPHVTASGDPPTAAPLPIRNA